MIVVFQTLWKSFCPSSITSSLALEIM